MRLKFWGARGSLATPYPESMRYGGDTSCVEIIASNGKRLIMDAGTGIRRLGIEMQREASESLEIDLFLTHGHWDHIQGFPFFTPAYLPGNTLRIYAMFKADGRLQESFSGMMGKLYFPIKLDQLSSKLEFKEILEESLDLGGVQVSNCVVNHPQDSLAFRIDDGHSSVVYCPDTEHVPGDIQPKLVELSDGAEYLIHDSQYTPEEYESHKGWGHSSYEAAAEVAKAARVKNLILFHHDPDHNDEKMDELVQRAQSIFPNTIAATRDLEIQTHRTKTQIYSRRQIPGTGGLANSSHFTLAQYEIQQKGNILNVVCPPSRTVMNSSEFQDSIIGHMDSSIEKVEIDFSLLSRPFNPEAIKTLGRFVKESQKRKIEMTFLNVSSQNYEMLKVTRFTEVIAVHKMESLGGNLSSEIEELQPKK